MIYNARALFIVTAKSRQWRSWRACGKQTVTETRYTYRALRGYDESVGWSCYIVHQCVLDLYGGFNKAIDIMLLLDFSILFNDHTYYYVKIHF